MGILKTTGKANNGSTPRYGKSMPAKTVTAGATGQQFLETAAEIAERFGVELVPDKEPGDNPYLVPPEQAFETLVRAGILTPAGNLRRRFK